MSSQSYTSSPRSHLATASEVRVLHRMDPRPTVQVVCAIIEAADGRVLVAQRPAHKHLGLKWEFAGGKVEANEEPRSALIREIREELGCAIAITGELPSFTHDYGTVLIEMIPFVAALEAQSPPPHPHEHVAVRWVTPAELDSMDLAPADWSVVASYRASRLSSSG